MTRSLSWKIRSGPDRTTVVFEGNLDEDSDFAELCARLRGEVVFDLGGIERINSCGVREWVNFVRDLEGVTALAFDACSPAVVAQLNVIHNFRGGARVRSVYVPYSCDRCNAQARRLVDLTVDAPADARFASFPCTSCSGEMELDDLPDRYLSFHVPS